MIQLLWQRRVYIVFIFLAFLFILPQFHTSYPSLIDDGTDLLEVRDSTLTEIIYNQLFISPRTRPLRLMYRSVLYFMFQLYMPGYFVANALLLGGTCILAYLILRKVHIPALMAGIATVSVLFLPSTAASYYRLGTDEPIQVFLILSGLLLLLHKQYTLACLCYALGCFVKETSVFYVLIPVCYLFSNKKYVHGTLMTAFFVLYAALLVWKLVTISDPYIHKMYASILQFIPAFYISPQVFGGYVSLVPLIYYWRLRELASPHYRLLIVSFAATVLPFVFWRMDQPYYHLIPQIMYILYLMVFIKVFALANKATMNRIGSIILAAYIVLIAIHIPTSARIMTDEHRRYIAQGMLVRYILEHDWTNYHIYIAVNGYEARDKIYTYFIKWNHPESVSMYPAESDLDKRAGDISHRMVLEFMRDMSAHKILVSDMALVGFDIQGTRTRQLTFADGNFYKYFIYQN